VVSNAGHVHRAAGRDIQPADDVEQRGLAGTRPPAHRDELAFPDRQAPTVSLSSKLRRHGVRCTLANAKGYVTVPGPFLGP